MHTFLSLSGAFRPAMRKPGKLRHVVGRLCVLSRQFKHVMRLSGVFVPFVGMLGQYTRLVMMCRECLCDPGNCLYTRSKDVQGACVVGQCPGSLDPL